YWIHGEHLIVDGEKMSKSKGNVFTLPELVDKYGGEVVRFMFMSVHYRKKLDFSDSFAQNAQNSYFKLRETLENLEFAIKSADDNKYPFDKEMIDMPGNLENDFRNALEDDMNIPKAIAVYHELSRISNQYLESGRNKDVLEKLLTHYRKFADILGIFAQKSEGVPEEIMELVKIREQARKDRDWDTSDALRDKIAQEGFVVQDTCEGPNVKRQKR
ncbi:MAG: DALR domain-containing protein, partial [Methanohalophilus sp.]